MANAPIRLPKAAKTFNVGMHTIVEFLKNKGFEIDDKPTSKISSEMYDVLMQEFGGQITIKEKAEAITLGNKKENVNHNLDAEGNKVVEVVEKKEEEKKRGKG